jgi:hypothetical protein
VSIPVHLQGNIPDIPLQPFTVITHSGMDKPLFPMHQSSAILHKPTALKNHGLVDPGRLRLFKPTFQWKERGIKG